MNDVMGIKQDSDIVHISKPPVDIVMNFEVKDSQGPSLKPMAPHFAKHPMDFEWNRQLCEMFIAHFESTHNLDLTADEQVDIEMMFEDRLMRLTRLLKWRSYRDNETVETHRHRVSNKHKADLDHQRLNT